MYHVDFVNYTAVTSKPDLRKEGTAEVVLYLLVTQCTKCSTNQPEAVKSKSVVLAES